ncbi:MAG TPA: RES family NAD+ phosphorylase [Bryobacteraceae bacterium]|nr:RES family NAD+ phosphorylase [Bryobacteraceae bacterium]
MELTPRARKVRLKDTCRLVPSLYPSRGVLDVVARPEDLAAIIELETWTNDRISSELGILHRIPPDEWVTGRPMASVIMAAFCHPKPNGGRFNGQDRGAWYAATSLPAAHAEVIYHRTLELGEVGVFDTRVQMRLYLADFHAVFHDVRAITARNAPYHDPLSYSASQALARQLMAEGSNGVIYGSVRYPGAECLACFRPALVTNVRNTAHFEYRWEGTRTPRVRRLGRPKT